MSSSCSDNTAKATRRKILKWGVASSIATAVYGLLSSKSSNAVDGSRGARSPFLQPFLDQLPISPIKQPTLLNPVPDKNPVNGEAGREPHQVWDQFPPLVTYAVHVKPGKHRFHAHLPEEEIWGYDGLLPGPMFVSRIGIPAVVRHYNELPRDHIGFGSPEISTHLHAGHTPSDSDGFAGDYFSPTKSGPTLPGGPGLFYDYHYPGLPPEGDPREVTGTLWYHDHREDFTAANVYKGLAGFFLTFDDLDTGDETTGLRLPSGVGTYDIPLLLQDKKFDASGHLFFDQFDPEGFLGDQFLVNGKVQPYFNVDARKYRFRLLNGNATRFFEMYLVDEHDRDQEFTFIASDGNLLPESLTLKRILLGMAERADIIVDFSKYEPGTKVYLVNRLEQNDPRKPTGKRLFPGIQMLEFRVGNRVHDPSQIPKKLRELPPINPAAVARTRNFKFNRTNGQWAINNLFFDPTRIDADPKRGVPEIWTLETSGGWAHPIHTHCNDFRILSINDNPPPPEWSGRKDTVSLLPGDKVKILVRFTDFTGRYVAHCHNTVHEDHAMMIRFDVVP
jgi:FtsP/CotA-like multicopper oxidase with cupredoxin domain